MIFEATVDAHDEEEQLMGFYNLIEENLATPFKTSVLGMRVTVESVIQTSRGIVADCVRGDHHQQIDLVQLPLPTPPPRGSEWIVAYRRWAGEA